MLDDAHYMQLALDTAARARAEGEPPFGAVLIDPDGAVLARAADAVIGSHDPTQHAETNLVRRACALRGPDLSGCQLFTTCEPCPMCFTAAWLARVSRIVWGCTMAEVIAATGGAQRELAVPAHEMNRLGGNAIELAGGVSGAACLALFAPAT